MDDAVVEQHNVTCAQLNIDQLAEVIGPRRPSFLCIKGQVAAFGVVANDTHATAVGVVASLTLCTWAIVSGWVRC